MLMVSVEAAKHVRASVVRIEGNTMEEARAAASNGMAPGFQRLQRSSDADDGRPRRSNDTEQDRGYLVCYRKLQ